MHSVVGCDFLYRFLTLDRLQRDSCFHFRAEASPLPRFHSYSRSRLAILHLIHWSKIWGAAHLEVPSFSGMSIGVHNAAAVSPGALRSGCFVFRSTEGSVKNLDKSYMARA